MNYLLDTNVVSELREPRARKPDRNVKRWSDHIPAESTYLSAITVMELELGALKLERHDPTQALVLRSWVNVVLSNFEGRILPIDSDTAQRAAALHIPTQRSPLDAFIAASAMVHAMTVVTRNTAHFEPMGVSTLNPWQPRHA